MTLQTLSTRSEKFSHSEKEKKKIKKDDFRNHLTNFNIPSKVIRRRKQRNIDTKGIPKKVNIKTMAFKFGLFGQSLSK